VVALPPKVTLKRPSNDDDNKSNECSPIEVESYSPISNCMAVAAVDALRFWIGKMLRIDDDVLLCSG
jgi:hypothetical protein